jgi:SSS family solute:Na+ symporter
MAQNFWTAIYAWTTCFLVTILISLATRQTKTVEDLRGLVYSLTPTPHVKEGHWYQRPEQLGLIVLGLAVLLNLLFW